MHFLTWSSLARMTRLQFALTHPDQQTTFGPRLGTLVVRSITLDTPTLLTSTSRGVIPHLSRDHVRKSPALAWLHVPFESFLEHTPPVPTLQPGPHPLHRFLGFKPDDHILSFDLRDPADVREMPPNGNSHVSAMCLRGVRKISPAQWRTYTNACQPDIVAALTDTPHRHPPFSQKRLTKSIDRSTAWLANLLATDDTLPPAPAPAVFVHLAGSTSHPARAAFTASLLEPLSPVNAALPSLDAGVTGYILDLAPLRATATAEPDSHSLLRTSLHALPPTKPRLAHGTPGPHALLRLLRDVGADAVDAPWAIAAAACGVSFDFEFPVRETKRAEDGAGKEELGCNLYDARYALDFGGLGGEREGGCACVACTDAQDRGRGRKQIVHGTDASEAADALAGADAHGDEALPGYTRAYVHHLLHTHEMGAHALLALHNLEIVRAFLAGVRRVLAADGVTGFAREVGRFEERYLELDADADGGEGEGDKGTVMREAKVMWAEVERARGKGRLAREREKEKGREKEDESV
ncbi:hypothetical protein D9615_003133 [Tricholomella constricta]|uniref:tRNA-guanine(15) transglycosylase-like domain-containing protein n=1 Tax=Tricholomella constricta TaxID=117010 RepID=A0A8H5HJK7_9AGAR|nr:hypothetical protein D9615_003133 [Tricholomella constricta]